MYEDHDDKFKLKKTDASCTFNRKRSYLRSCEKGGSIHGFPVWFLCPVQQMQKGRDTFQQFLQFIILSPCNNLFIVNNLFGIIIYNEQQQCSPIWSISCPYIFCLQPQEFLYNSRTQYSFLSFLFIYFFLVYISFTLYYVFQRHIIL